jgi:ribonuclease III
MPDPVPDPGGAPPPEPVAPAVAALEARIGWRIPDAALAQAALTHKSFVNEHRGEALTDNERLEFLGDAVIDLAVSHRLMQRFPGAREGDLSKLRAALVDEAALARLARRFDLGPLLRLGRGEELTGGREKASLLADALEALAAVLYLCGGLEAVFRLLDGALAEAFELAAAGTLDRDYKTQLQELAQSRARATPRYRVVAERGPDHEKTFEVELDLRGEVIGRGEGRSKKDAEQAAARLGLDVLASRGPTEPLRRAPAEAASDQAVTPLLGTMPVVTADEIRAALAAEEVPAPRPASAGRVAPDPAPSHAPSAEPSRPPRPRRKRVAKKPAARRGARPKAPRKARRTKARARR